MSKVDCAAKSLPSQLLPDCIANKSSVSLCVYVISMQWMVQMRIKVGVHSNRTACWMVPHTFPLPNLGGLTFLLNNYHVSCVFRPFHIAKICINQPPNPQTWTLWAVRQGERQKLNAAELSTHIVERVFTYFWKFIITAWSLFDPSAHLILWCFLAHFENIFS